MSGYKWIMFTRSIDPDDQRIMRDRVRSTTAAKLLLGELGRVEGTDQWEAMLFPYTEADWELAQVVRGWPDVPEEPAVRLMFVTGVPAEV